MPAICEQCGSVRVSRSKHSSIDRLVAAFTGKSPWQCRRCGWRGRAPWSDDDIVQLPSGDDASRGDPTLRTLDTPDRSVPDAPDLIALDRNLAVRPRDPA